MQEMWVWSLGQEDPLEEGMTAHSSILAWRIPWTEDPGGLQSLGLQKSQTWLSDWITILIHMGRCTCFWNLEWGCRSLLAMLWGGRAQSASEMSIKDHHSLHCGPWVGTACLCSQSGLWWSPSISTVVPGWGEPASVHSLASGDRHPFCFPAPSLLLPASHQVVPRVSEC